MFRGTPLSICTSFGFGFGNSTGTAFVISVLCPHDVKVVPIVKLSSKSYFLRMLGTIHLVGKTVGKLDGEPFILIVVHVVLVVALILRRTYPFFHSFHKIRDKRWRTCLLAICRR